MSARLSTIVERSLTGRAWELAEAEDEPVVDLATRLGIPDVVARVLAARDIDAVGAAVFLEPRLRQAMPDPFHLLDMERAATRLIDALDAGEPIGMIGDYDADGATSTALLCRYLQSLGGQCHIEIPDRLADGYGPNAGALQRLADKGCQLVVVLDSGTTAFEVLAGAADAGQDVVVVDHHAAEDRLPQAFAVINPNRRDQTSDLGGLAAVGVTFMLVVATNAMLRQRQARVPDPRQWLDLVAVGTVCDVVPLEGLNRAFVHQGLKIAAKTDNLGLKSLGELAGVSQIADARQLGFAIGPRLNAGGRLGRSHLACRLLCSREASEAQSIAMTLDGLNKERQQLEQNYLRAARQQAEAQAGEGRSVLVLSGEDWHQGVVGIVASRIVELFHRPTFVIGWHAGCGKGSGRSVPGVDIGAMVIAARHDGLLEAGGGHPMAAGLTISPDRLAAFALFAQNFVPEIPQTQDVRPPSLRIEARMAPSAASLALIDRLDQLAPFGAGNPEPRLMIDAATIVDARTVGRGHVSCHVAGPAGGRLKAIAFRADDKGLSGHLLRASTPLRLAGKLTRNRFAGREMPQFEIEDVAIA